MKNENRDTHNRKFTLRKAAESDLYAVTMLYHAACQMENSTWNEYYPTAEDAAADLDAGGLYVYVDGETVIGAVSVAAENELDELKCWRVRDDRVKEIARVTISGAYRGLGLAAKMLEELLEILKIQGCSAVHLLAAKCNPAALKTYERLEFEYLTECEMYGNTYFAGEKEL